MTEQFGTDGWVQDPASGKHLSYHMTSERSGSGWSCSIHFDDDQGDVFTVGGMWAEGTSISREMADHVAATALANHWRDTGKLDVFLPWDSTSETLHFDVLVDGVRHAARISRECLSDNCGLNVTPLTANQVRVAFNSCAVKAREIAARMIRAGREAVIHTADWR
jgi:hypothetical protein